jgi:hypothetical protein
VRNFSNPSAGPWQVSDGGGTEPLWSHSGTEIFYRDNAGAMVAATVETRPTFSVIRREILFDASPYAVNDDNRWYATSPDDRRFLMFRYGGDARRLVIVDNLWAELRAADRK